MAIKSSLVCLLVLFLCSLVLSEGREIQKRSFSGLGCMGVYDKAKFARLDRVCEDCYQLYRESDIHTLCRANCFKNAVFTRCVKTLLLQKDQDVLDNMVDELYGKRK